MEILHLDPLQPEPALIRQAVEFALSGRVFLMPTDTVYGISVAVLPDATPADIYVVKQRDLGKAIPLLVRSAQDLDTYGKSVPDYAYRLAQSYWPGALALIVKASDRVPKAFKAHDGTVALRAPGNTVALSLLKELNAPIASSSANKQGGEPALTLDDLDESLIPRIALALDGGRCSVGVASTIVSCLEKEPRIVRAGALLDGIELLLH
ncbi:MAG: L-threonylcarbamoyladenylate synthase [Coriobacteriia bacterium]|nr:L-threonylcarbamoyladenylate synthase [Coriobacteriia bacterium]